MMKISDRFNKERFLFRYRPINENNFSALENNRLYFSVPEKFNDPYDNLIYANLQTILSNVYGNISYGMDDYLSRLKERNPKLAFIGYQFWKEERREETVNMFLGQICDAVDSIKKNVRHNVKIICFSEVYNSMLMWSHYADDHKGYVLIYDVEELKGSIRYSENDERINNNIRLEKVKYVEKQIDLSEDIENYVRSRMPQLDDATLIPDGSIPQYKLRDFMTQKSIEWAYEKEWRMIPRIINLDEQSPLGYIECKPQGIILGARCGDENSRKIIAIAKQKKIPVYRMFLNEFSPEFKLDIGEGENAKII